MEIKLWWSDKIKCPETMGAATNFFQAMIKRLIVGEIRYGPAKKEQKYMTRLRLELNEYKKKGNMEQLINIANYALLESMAPENGKFHFDSAVESVTRGKV